RTAAETSLDNDSYSYVSTLISPLTGDTSAEICSATCNVRGKEPTSRLLKALISFLIRASRPDRISSISSGITPTSAAGESNTESRSTSEDRVRVEEEWACWSRIAPELVEVTAAGGDDCGLVGEYCLPSCPITSVDGGFSGVEFSTPALSSSLLTVL